MILGFTGTQIGLTPVQMDALRAQLEAFGPGLTHVAHGDCVGADADFDRLVCMLPHRPWRFIHPCDIESKRARCGLWRPQHSSVYPVRPPLERNLHIIKQSTSMLACPKGPEERRSGTWATVRAAVKEGKEVLIIMPDGERIER